MINEIINNLLLFLLIRIFICNSKIIIFDSLQYRAGHFAFKSNGDMVIEYSYDNYRLFYGLKSNGKYFFKDETNNQTATKEITITYDNNKYFRYESKNIFVSINNKEYLFSISVSDEAVVELYDFENENKIESKVNSIKNFLGHAIFSFVFSLLKIDNSPGKYLISYISEKKYKLGKFEFSKFGLEKNSDFSLNMTSKFYDIKDFDNRIVSCFIMSSEIVIFFVNWNKKNYQLYIYNSELAILNDGNSPNIDNITNFNDGFGLFSKAYHLENRDAIFIYFTSPDSNSLKLKIGTISNDSKSFDTKIEKSLADDNKYNYNLNYDVRMNDFVKIDSRRFVYNGLAINDNKTMYIYLFDLYNDYKSMNIRIYKEVFNQHKLFLEVSADVYNGHLIFTSTAITGNNTIYSILILFGYANYTDSIINISEYFMDEYVNNEKNLFDKLLENIQIENNIFQYYIDKNEIKLVSIPHEILFYNKSSDSEILISNGEHLSKDFTFKQNVTVEKNDEYYYLDYQPIIKEPTYENYNNGTINYEEVNKIDSYQINYKQKLFYGRTITVQFKLCHRYCQKCLKYGYNDNNQFCLSCLPNYRYFDEKEFNSTCVPEGYFYDNEENKLAQCNDSNSKFYINLTDSKKICFKSSHECPEEYPFLNTTNNECLNLTVPILTTIPQIPTTIHYIPSTILKLPTTTPEIITTNFKMSTNMEEVKSSIIEVTSNVSSIPLTLENTESETIFPELVSTIINVQSSISIIPTTFKETPTTIPKIPTTILLNAEKTELNQISVCNYQVILNENCDFQNKTNTEIYEIIKNELISSFPSNGVSIVIKGIDNYVFQITNNINELSTLNGSLINEYNLSMIDLAKCEDALKEANNIDDDTPLNILKYEKITNLSIEKNVQYEVYAPNSSEKLDLSICKDTPVDVYIPIILSSETKTKYENLKSQGYDLFDKNSDFYTDICTPYKSPDGTDVALSTRNSEFYNNTETSCQQNCRYDDYVSDTSYLKCVCSVVEEDIDLKEPEKFTGMTFISSFYDVLKNSNYKIVTCYKLVFRLINFKINFGCIVTLVLFLLYFIFLFLYMIRGITQLKIDIAKFYDNSIIKKENRVKIKSPDDDINNSEKQQMKEKNKSKTVLIADKKVSIKGRNMRTNILSKKKKDVIINNKRKKFKSQPNESHNKFNNNTNPPKKSILNDINKLCQFKNENSISKYSKDSKLNLNNNKILIFNNLFQIESNQKSKTKPILITKQKKQQKLNKKLSGKYQYSNMELNEMEYLEAKQYDKRAFGEVYWSLLSREHLILFTFFSCGDYNLMTIKLSRFFFLVCTDMAMNVFFFTDESMHKIYENKGEWDFAQNITQSVYSLIISQIIQVFICYLTLTDKHVFQIKKNFYEKKNKNAEIFNILKCIRIKLCIFYVYTFIFFLAYWYLITSFCAVYNNTQKTFIKDSLSSFIGGIILPFPLYIFPALLRIISLKPKKRNLSCLYKFSEFIPIF